ncbi:hypothetical protein ACIQVK_19540 [Streptomyces sp. NPDC090493]|uniref:hypothetical protein n=1 Tax=Streptomyces sp. NPDC090493 TaxID=3365964 RepID=UPI0037F64EEC
MPALKRTAITLLAAAAVAVITAPVLAAASLAGWVLAALTILAAGAVGAALCLPLGGLTNRRTAASPTADLILAAS